MRTPVRRPALIALALLLAIGVAPSAVGAADTSAISADAAATAEQLVLTLTNKRRTDKGLVALRLDPRLTELARERAEYMARTEEFSHTQSDGTDVFDLITASDIAWYGAGEIIAWNTASLLDYSAQFAVKGWMDSPGHRAIVLSSGYNYVGFGLAISPTSGKRYWAGVYLKGPDRTAGWTKLVSVTKKGIDTKRVRVTIDWTGGDKRLQVLTSGFRYYQMQRRMDGGAWHTYDLTTSSVISRVWYRGHVNEFRFRVRDKAGNWSAWRTVTVRT
jgi:uncharacterized protein YkwD